MIFLTWRDTLQAFMADEAAGRTACINYIGNGWTPPRSSRGKEYIYALQHQMC